MHSSLSFSYATGSVSGNWTVGGLAGGNRLSTFNENYTSCSVSGNYETGGLSGNNYSTQIDNCIWNLETSGQTIGIGNYESGSITNLLGKTTAEMQMMSTYTDLGWDFVGESVNGDDDIWDIDDEVNSGFPYIYDIEFPVGNDEDVIENGKWKIENYPNPFNPETTISSFTTEGSENTEVSICNVKGQKVETLVNEILPAGQHSVIWNAERRSSGIYFYMIRADGIVRTGKMMLLK